MKNKVLLLISCLVLFMAAVIPGCNSIENVTNSSTKIIVDSITGTDLTGETGATTVFSDVLYVDPDTGATTVFSDNAEAVISARLLDPQQASGTYYQDVIIDQVDIQYSRTDGLSVEGKDVPYGFSQKVNIKVIAGSSSTLGFVILQHNAKLESPLVELIHIGQEQILKLEAKITFHGKDLAGNRVESVVGHISVWCSNFSNDT